MEPMITYFGDMVSFFDEIAHDLLRTQVARINIPAAIIERLMANAEGAVFHTNTPHGVVKGGKPTVVARH